MIINFISILILISILSFFVTNNPIYNIFALVIIFLLVNSIFIFLNLDFLALMMIIVYVGAITILFLFIVMMINIKILERNFLNIKKKLPLGILIIIALFLQLITILRNLYIFNNTDKLNVEGDNINLLNLQFNMDYLSLNNFKILGFLLYNNLYNYIIIISIVLLLAMLSAISLTYKKKNILNQQMHIQLLRKKSILIANRSWMPNLAHQWFCWSWRKSKELFMYNYLTSGNPNRSLPYKPTSGLQKWRLWY